jgi:hypothetical protein
MTGSADEVLPGKLRTRSAYLAMTYLGMTKHAVVPGRLRGDHAKVYRDGDRKKRLDDILFRRV